MFEGDGHADCHDAEEQDLHRARLQGGCVFWWERFVFWNKEAHDDSRYEVADGGRDEQVEEFEELNLFRLPYHEGCNVSERAEGSACVGGVDDVDAGQCDELAVSCADGDCDCAEHEGGGQVVGDGRDEEGQCACGPEELAQVQAHPYEFVFQDVEDLSFLEGADVGHGGEEE